MTFSVATIGVFVCLAAFCGILANSKIPNWVTLPVLAPIAVFSGVLGASEVYAVANASGLHLMLVINLFSGMFAATGVDLLIGDFFDKKTRNLKGERREMAIFAILYLIAGCASMLMENSYIAFAMLPVIFGISRKTGISHSKMILFAIYASTLGGAITLIGTPTNVFANSALEAAGLQGFGMFDFAWVAVPIFVFSGIYMVTMNRWCASYEEEVPGMEGGEVVLTPEMLAKQKIVGVAFAMWIVTMVLDNLLPFSLNPIFIGYGVTALLILSNVVPANKAISNLNGGMIPFILGIYLMIEVMKKSGLSELFGSVVLNLVGQTQNLYIITAILFFGAAVITQFMNNMGCAGMLAPVGISIAEAIGADPRAIVLTIAIGAGCSYLTPVASGTNQSLFAWTNLKFQDFAKFGWPLLLISFACCELILPLVFPYF